MIDNFNRKIDYVRISVTDRCDLRCLYCMPQKGVIALPHSDILTYEEILRIAECFSELGLSKIKITGGEPLIRADVTDFIKKLKNVSGIEKVTLTTNGTQLSNKLDELIDAKIDGINLSLDTLDPMLYKQITGNDLLQNVLEGLYRALESPEIKLKINCVPMGYPEQNLVELAEIAKNNPVHVRFIEMMPIGLGVNFTFTSETEIIKQLEQVYGPLVPYNEKLGNGPCHYYSIEGFQGKIGFISAISHKFCDYCNRIRLTADGHLKTCLQYNTGFDLKKLIRSGGSDMELKEAITNTIKSKPAEHSFTEVRVPRRETKSMFQIGG